MGEKKENTVNDQEYGTLEKAADEVLEDEEKSLIIKLNKPYLFERTEYTEIDLTGLSNLTGSDMIAVNKILKVNSRGVDIMPEVSMEYAFHLAARAANKPVEFFMQLPPNYAMKVKDRIVGFLFG